MKQQKCVVIDYGLGNVFSVCKALEKFNISTVLSSKKSDIINADKLILPGVGAFRHAYERLKEKNLDYYIKEYLLKERPFLGICVGMQLLMDKGFEFGETDGLGLFKGTVEKISAENELGEKLKVPIIGWNNILPKRESEKLFNDINKKNSFYFVHSFSANVVNFKDILATSKVGNTEIVSAINKDHIYGVQFHPERSDFFGHKLLKNFVYL